MGRGYLKEMAAGIEANKSAVLAEARELASEIDDIIGFSVPETGPLSNADSYMPDFMELGFVYLFRLGEHQKHCVHGMVGNQIRQLQRPCGSGVVCVRWLGQCPVLYGNALEQHQIRDPDCVERHQDGDQYRTACH